MKDLKLSLIIEALDRATAPLRKVGEALGHVHEHLEKLHHALHKLGLAEFIGTAFFTGAAVEFGHTIFEVTDRVAEMGETALRAAEKTGASVEAMQQWSWAAKQVGVDADNLSHAFAMMEVHVGSALKGNKESLGALKLVGIGMKEVRELSKNPSAMFGRIIEGFQNLKNPTAQAVAAQALFSRSWIEMAPLLKAPREEVGELMAQLRKAHVVMTKEDAEASLKFIQAKQNLGLAISGLGVRIGAELIPRLTTVIDKITDWIESLKPEDIKAFTDAVGKLADEIPKLLPKVEAIIDKTIDFTDKLLKASDNTKTLKGVLIGLVTFMGIQALVAFVSTAASVASFGNACFAAAGKALLAIPAIEGLAGAMVMFDGAALANPLGIIVLAIAAIIAVVALLVFGLIQLYKHWDDVVAAMENGCKNIEKAFVNLESKMPPWLKTLLNATGSVLTLQFPALGALVNGIHTMAHAAPPAAPGRPASSPLKAPNDFLPWPSGYVIPAGPIFPAADTTQPGARSRSSQVLGTIVVKAEPGTKVQSMEASSGIELRHSRGLLSA